MGRKYTTHLIVFFCVLCFVFVLVFLHGRRYFQHAHIILIVDAGKRGAYELIHSDLRRQHSFGTTLRFTSLVPADSRQRTPSVTQMRDPINSGLNRWRMPVLNKYMDTAAELGRNPVSEHQIQPEYVWR